MGKRGVTQPGFEQATLPLIVQLRAVQQTLSMQLSAEQSIEQLAPEQSTPLEQSCAPSHTTVLVEAWLSIPPSHVPAPPQ